MLSAETDLIMSYAVVCINRFDKATKCFIEFRQFTPLSRQTKEVFGGKLSEEVIKMSRSFKMKQSAASITSDKPWLANKLT